MKTSSRKLPTMNLAKCRELSFQIQNLADALQEKTEYNNRKGFAPDFTKTVAMLRKTVGAIKAAREVLLDVSLGGCGCEEPPPGETGTVVCLGCLANRALTKLAGGR